jgi:hypothetical protein
MRRLWLPLLLAWRCIPQGYGALAFLLTWLAVLALATAAHAQDDKLRYATFPNLATAQSWNTGAWQNLRCTPQPQCEPVSAGTYIYPMVGLTDGTKVAIVLHSGDLHTGETVCNGLHTKCFSLTANEILSLATRAAMGTQLPDILSVAFMNGRLIGGELTAINTYANIPAHSAFKANWNLLISGPIDLQAPLVGTVMAELQSAGVLSAARVAAITAPNPAAAVVPP